MVAACRRTRTVTIIYICMTYTFENIECTMQMKINITQTF